MKKATGQAEAAVAATAGKNNGNGSKPRRRRQRFVWKRVKVKTLYRTWLRHGSGTKLLHSEVVEEIRRVRVPVEDKGGKEVAK